MIKAGDRVRRIDYPLYHGRGNGYDIGSEWTVQSVNASLNKVELKEIPGTWDLDRFELIKEAKMCTCNEQSGVCVECSRKYKAQLIPGKRYKHKSWNEGWIFLSKTSTGNLVFENKDGFPFTACSKNPDEFSWVREKQKRWINFYKDSVGAGLHNSKADADNVPAAASRIACIEVEYYEGQGL